MSLAASPALILFLIVAVYWLTSHIRQRTGSFWCNPVFLSTAVLIGYLYATDTPYPQFHAAAQFIDFWLQPAVVCLAVPLYVQWQKIRKQWLPILLSQLLGSLVGIVSAVLIAHWMGAERAVTLSLAAKSVTNPIALEITHSIGGIPAITAATVIMAGMLGQMLGFRALQAGRIRNPSSRGMSMGSASHAMGISAALEQSQKLAAYASLGLIFNGVLTAFLVPVVLPLMGF
ncbi:LrgB family protein [Paralysiella testudinis]|uniref:LrgB family protein n=1 Tax=Paralysiella testudinis TaxID=2809020 RepID=A0A892ZH24_9NEIS|nr:LrgB family protein [Paralysiella testudinis]QRQ81758.1 LrgB family protein [Paralysiella testudinis]